MGKLMLNDILYSGGDSSVELTQAEYDALSTAEKMNGTTYFITDANGDGSQFHPTIYSSTEREIGVWLDGKPLYEKTVNFGALPNATTKTVAHNISNVEHVWIYEGWAQNNVNGFTNMLSLATSSLNNQWYFGVDPTQIQCWAGSNREVYDTCYVILHYTKSTDTAGSGTWTPQGTPSHHYSTTEHIVGTWIDGKTIYEKCFYVSNLAYTTANDFKEIGTISGADNIISVSGILSNSANNKQRPLAYIDPATGKYAILSFEFTADHGNANSLFFTSSDTWATANLKAIVQYTKSSS